MPDSLNKSNIIAAIAIAFASIQSFKFDFTDGNFKFELTKTALAAAEAKLDELEQDQFNLATVVVCEETK